MDKTNALLAVIVAALGVRLLEMLVDPAAFESLPDIHQRLFRASDKLLTGASICLSTLM